MLRDTCDKKCPFWKQYKEKCPNFIQTTWQEDGDHQTKLISDCAPKRSTLMMMELYSRLLGTQQAAEQARNRSEDAIIQVKALANEIKELTSGGDDAIPELPYIELPRGDCSGG